MLTTPTWSDLRPGTAFIALTGLGQGAMHVEYVDSPLAYDARRVRISAEQYGRLVAYVQASFVRDADGAVRRIDAPGYFDTDAFYEAVPTYTFWYTCNEWTRRALAAAGVRTAWWAPFDIAVMRQLPAGPGALNPRGARAAQLSSTVERSPAPRRRLRRRSASPSASAGTCGHAYRPD